MTEKIIAGIVLIFMGGLALYTVFIKPSLSKSHLDEALRVPSLINRVIRTVLGIGAILLGIYAFLRAAGSFQ